MSSIYKLRKFEELKITIDDLRKIPGISVLEEKKECYGIMMNLYFVTHENQENKQSLELGFNQGFLYGFTRYDDNHNEADRLIALIGSKLNFDFYEVQE